MSETYATGESMDQNLVDAGCDESMRDKCMLLVKEGRFGDLLSILAQYRRSLLDTVHTGQKQIDCLDYLIYTLKKQR